MISEASVRRAIGHLGLFGDTDLFPRLPEMRCFLERPGTIAKDCKSLSIGQYGAKYERITDGLHEPPPYLRDPAGLTKKLKRAQKARARASRPPD
jgi:hypothetical protein